ncbi:DUF317 domain-containing protein [Kitasatospora purpeofusca]|uniref:DUF317 domain-containing protein n=1 Tax=Kitasatospora purpeofusca TaxID=67352 RepID=UPI0035D53734
MLTGAAERGTWSVTLSSRTPAPLLQAAAATLLRPAVRPLAEVSTVHRGRLSVEPVSPLPARRALVSPRYLAGSDSTLPVLPSPSPLWQRSGPGRAQSSCGRVRVAPGPGRGVRVTAGPDGPDHRLAWTAQFTDGTPPEIAEAWLESLSDSLAADIDLGTGATFAPGPGMSVGDAVQPLTDAGWIAHADGADLHLASPDGHARARITHGLLAPAATAADALAHTVHWGAAIDVTGAPGGRWRASVSSLTPLHLVRALTAAVTDPAPVDRRSERIPQQYIGSVRLTAVDPALSPAALASRSRSSTAAAGSSARRTDSPRTVGNPAPQAGRTR